MRRFICKRAGRSVGGKSAQNKINTKENKSAVVVLFVFLLNSLDLCDSFIQTIILIIHWEFHFEKKYIIEASKQTHGLVFYTVFSHFQNERNEQSK